MRLITVRAPKGLGEKIASIALEADIDRIGIQQGKSIQKHDKSFEEDVLEMHTATPKAKMFIERLTDSAIYDPTKISFTIRHPESVYALEPPEKEFYPIVRPTSDVYAELWQFSIITPSLIIRVFLAALLVAYGMQEGYIPLIIAGLLFLPYHHHILSVAVGATLGEWKFFRQGLKALFISTLCIFIAGIVIGLLMEPEIKFTEFHSTPLRSFLISVIIGLAAGFGSIDDSGRRELIGLAATAHVAIYPIWFGIKIIFGFDPADKPMESLMIFLIDVTTITLSAAIVYKIMKLHGAGIKKFVRRIK